VNQNPQEIVDIAMDVAYDVKRRFEVQNYLSALEIGLRSVANRHYQIFVERRNWTERSNFLAVRPLKLEDRLKGT
jgi:hypothetical protein